LSQNSFITAFGGSHSNPQLRWGLLIASNFYPEIASDHVGGMQEAIQLFLRVA
jgi:hypothetical protein